MSRRRLVSMTTYNNAIGTTLSEIPPDLVSSYPRYMAAHALLPNDPRRAFDPEDLQDFEEQARKRLTAPEQAPTSTVLLRAIVILGHCGTKGACDALADFICTGHELAAVAALALREGRELMGARQARARAQGAA